MKVGKKEEVGNEVKETYISVCDIEPSNWKLPLSLVEKKTPMVSLDASKFGN